MMEYLFLAGACLCFSLQFIFPKLFQKRTDGSLHASMWSSLLGGVSIFVIFFCLNGFSLSFSKGALLLAAVYAVSSIVCTAASIIGMGFSSVAVITLYTLLGGVVLPFFYGVFALSERPSAFRWAGAFVLIAAAVVPYLINALGPKDHANDVEASKTGSARGKAAICCALVFVTNGLISIVTTEAMRIEDAVSDKDFLLIATAIRVALSLAILVLMILKKPRRPFLPVDVSTGKPAGFGVFMLLALFCFGYAVLNGAGNIFNLNCAKTMDASLQYPVISASCIVLSAVFGLVLFKERPGKGDLFGIGLSIAGLILTLF